MNDRIGSSFRIMIVAVVAISLLTLASALVEFIRHWGYEWLLVAALAWFFLRWFWRHTARERALTGRGFFVGRRVGVSWIYDELHDGVICSLKFPLEYVGRGEYLIVVPGEEQWRAALPAWARDRRAEIIERLETVFRRSGIRVDA
jgi:apolipoprotein N-acyltransferase